jgi:rhodanese-related sulfurtransferase
MNPNLGALVALGVFSLFGYSFWRGTVVLMDARRAVRSGALLIHAGSPEEFHVSHVFGSVNIPASDIARRRGEVGSVTRDIVVYARSGFQSARAAHILRSIGYRSVINAGPMARWDASAVEGRRSASAPEDRVRSGSD